MAMARLLECSAWVGRQRLGFWFTIHRHKVQYQVGGSPVASVWAFGLDIRYNTWLVGRQLPLWKYIYALFGLFNSLHTLQVIEVASRDDKKETVPFQCICERTGLS